MPRSLPYEFNSPSSAIFCLKQATQLFTTFIEAGVTRSDSPKKHDCSSGFSPVLTPNCAEGPSRAAPAGELSPTRPRDQLPDAPWLPAEKGLPELPASGSRMLLCKWHPLPTTPNTNSGADALERWPRYTSAIHLCRPSPPALLRKPLPTLQTDITSSAVTAGSFSPRMNSLHLACTRLRPPAQAMALLATMTPYLPAGAPANPLILSLPTCFSSNNFYAIQIARKHLEYHWRSNSVNP